MTSDHALQLALEHYRAGRLDEAEALCGQVLESQPSNQTARRLLARFEQAVATAVPSPPAPASSG